MKCPSCGKAELVQDTRDLPYSYKGESTVIADVTGDFCPACGEAVMSPEHGKRYADALLAFNKQVNASIIDPKVIARVRTKLNLGQHEAADLFGGGVNAFSRCETGKTKPSLALVKLLALLDRHPELLGELREEAFNQWTRGEATRNSQ